MTHGKPFERPLRIIKGAMRCLLVLESRSFSKYILKVHIRYSNNFIPPKTKPKSEGIKESSRPYVGLLWYCSIRIMFVVVRHQYIANISVFNALSNGSGLVVGKQYNSKKFNRAINN